VKAVGFCSYSFLDKAQGLSLSPSLPPSLSLIVVFSHTHKFPPFIDMVILIFFMLYQKNYLIKKFKKLNHRISIILFQSKIKYGLCAEASSHPHLGCKKANCDLE
jgi:hypothetical protein